MTDDYWVNEDADSDLPGFDLIVSDNWSEQWDWNLTDVYYHPESGKYYVYEDGGCSCNFPYEDFNGVSDLRGPMTFAQAVRGLSNAAKDKAMKRKESNG